MSVTIEEVKAGILDVADFPKPGITFKDITPVLQDPALFACIVDLFCERWIDKKIDQVVGIESRGFIFGAAVAHKMGVGLTLLRKPGKLPRKIVSQSYDLEYGQDSLQLHEDSFAQGNRVALIDDVLATGGTAAAAIALVEKAGGDVVEAGFVMELTFLPGAEKIRSPPFHALIQY